MMLPKKPEEETDTSTSFESFVKKRRKEIDTSYKFTVGGKLRDGSETQWTSKFDETLEYLMYPSLHSLPDDPIFADKQGSRPNSRQRTKPGSPKRGGRGRRTRRWRLLLPLRLGFRRRRGFHEPVVLLLVWRFDGRPRRKVKVGVVVLLHRST